MSCEACQRRKHTTSASPGLIQTLPSPHRAFERLGIGLFGPLPPSTHNNRYVAVPIDHLTRYLITTPLPTGSPAEITNFFVEEVLLRYGAPPV